jgi:hypothetical protein
MINSNLHKQLGLAPAKKSAFSNEIFILDKDRLKVFVFNRLTNNSCENSFIYDAEGN